MKQTITSKQITWDDHEAPEVEELAALVRELNLLPVDAEFIVQDSRRPEITVRPDYTIILIQVPVFQKVSRVTQGISLFFIVKENSITTVHYQPIIVLQKAIQDFNDNPEKQADMHGDTAMNLALYITHQLYEASFTKLQRLNKHVEIAEDAVFNGNERKMVEEIAVLTRDVMDFRKIIRPQRHLFAKLPETTLDEESQAQWQRLHNQIYKLWEFLSSIYESVEQLAKTNDTLLQHKENELLRLLSMYSLLSFPALLLVQIFNPKHADATPVDSIIFWLTFTVFISALVFIFTRYRSKRIF